MSSRVMNQGSNPPDPPSLMEHHEFRAARFAGAVFYRRDLPGDIVLWTRGLQSLIGSAPPAGRSTQGWWLERIHPEDRQTYDGATALFLESGWQMNVEYRVRTHDDQWVRLVDEAVVVRDETSGAAHLMGSLHLICGPETADTVEQAIEGFLRRIFHDMRTPLGSILIWLQVLRLGGPGQSESAGALDAIQKSVGMLEGFIDDLVAYSRMAARAVHLQLNPLRPAAIIESALEASKPLAATGSVQLTSTLDAMVGPIAGDAERIRLLVRALLSNSISFTPPGGEVNVSLTRSDFCARITVRDDGPGIGDDLIRIAGGYPAASERCQGMSLHLAMVLALLHGGTLTASGEAVGNTFTVLIPLMSQPVA
ncbi:MAG TPA: PAS domain-containing sensor histidine kinase [Patescibacteria group bacterium]|nr:PAS domain-containing sensor histidine kinase [Patescibacteria group bacterium]